MIIVEIISQKHMKSEFRRFNSNSISIGRGFDNDLILRDPFISASHIIIETLDDGGWLVKDNCSRNGLFVNRKAASSKEARIVSGDEIIIGKTKLRIYSSSHIVAPARKIIDNNTFVRKINNKMSSFAAILGLVVLYCLEGYAHSIESTPEYGKFLMMAVFILFISVVWSSVWALVTRMLKNRSRFFLHLTMTCFFYCLMLPIKNIAGMFGYISSEIIVELISMFLLAGGLFTLLLIGHLAVATNLSVMKRAVFSCLTTSCLVLVAIIVFGAYISDFNPDPDIYGTIKPPVIKISPSKSIKTFLVESKFVFDS